MRRLVRVDAGVLDDDLTRHASGRRGIGHPVVHAARERRPVQEDVDVSAARHLRLAHPRRPRELRGQALGDLAWLAAQRLGQVEGRGQGEVAQLRAGRILERHRGQVGVEGRASRRAHRLAELGMDVEDHWKTRSGEERANPDYSVPTADRTGRLARRLSGVVNTGHARRRSATIAT